MKYVYILRSEQLPEKLYIGVSPDPRRRLADHNQSKCISTKKFKPWRIVHLERYQDDNAAFQREQQLKKWSRGKKEALIAGDRDLLKQLSKRED